MLGLRVSAPWLSATSPETRQTDTPANFSCLSAPRWGYNRRVGPDPSDDGGWRFWRYSPLLDALSASRCQTNICEEL